MRREFSLSLRAGRRRGGIYAPVLAASASNGCDGWAR